MDKNANHETLLKQFRLMHCRKATVAGPPTILFLPPRNGFTLEKIGVNAMGSGLVLATARRDSRGVDDIFFFIQFFFSLPPPHTSEEGEDG